jgi:hypothetical protein
VMAAMHRGGAVVLEPEEGGGGGEGEVGRSDNPGSCGEPSLSASDCQRRRGCRWVRLSATKVPQKQALLLLDVGRLARDGPPCYVGVTTSRERLNGTRFEDSVGNSSGR